MLAFVLSAVGFHGVQWAQGWRATVCPLTAGFWLPNEKGGHSTQPESGGFSWRAARDLGVAARTGRGEGRSWHLALVPTLNNTAWFLLSAAQGAKDTLTQKHFGTVFTYELSPHTGPSQLAPDPRGHLSPPCRLSSPGAPENQWQSARRSRAEPGGFHGGGGRDGEKCHSHTQSLGQVRISQENMDKDEHVWAPEKT